MKNEFYIPAVLVKAKILWEGNNVSETLILIEPIKNLGEFGYRKVVDFFFKQGEVDRAIEIVEEGIQRSYNLQDLQVFYTMSKGNLVEAAYLMEIYQMENMFFRQKHYSILLREFFYQGSKHDYLLGIEKAAKQYFTLCEKYVKKAMAWRKEIDFNVHAMRAKIKSCNQFKNSDRLRVLLKFIEKEEIFDLIYLLLKDKIEKNNFENFLYAKSIIKMKIKEQYQRAIFILQNLLDTNTSGSFYTKDIQHLLSIVYLFLGNYKGCIQESENFIIDSTNDISLWCAIYANDWNTLENFIQQREQQPHSRNFLLFNSKNIYHRIYFYKSILLIARNKLQKAEEFLNVYLQQPDEYNTIATYIMFTLQYFQVEKQLQKVLINIIQYPYANYSNLEHSISLMSNYQNISEFKIFQYIWYVSQSNYDNSHPKFIQQLKNLQNMKKNKNATLFLDQIDFWILSFQNTLENQSNTNKKSIPKKSFLQVPHLLNSPFRILFN